MEEKIFNYVIKLTLYEEYEKAILFIRDTIKKTESDPKFHHLQGQLYSLLGGQLFNMGRLDEAWESYKKDFEITNYYCENGVSDKLGITIIRGRLLGKRIGEFSKQIDLFIKAAKLGYRKDRPVIILNNGPFCLHNKALLRYWEKYITIIDDIKTKGIIDKARRESATTTYSPIKNGLTIESDFAWMDIQKEWEAQGREPLLKTSEMDEERGAKAMATLGVPHDAWFVSLHCRSDGLHNDNQSNRSVDINSYSRAIEEVVRNGGWVLRLGDRSMEKLGEMKNVIDYAHHPLRQDWLDLYIIAKCKFMIATASGPCSIAPNFGTPQVNTNVHPFLYRVWSKDDIYLPALEQNIKTGELLSFKENAHNFYATEKKHNLEKLGRRVVKNTPEELKDAVSEMIDKIIYGKQNNDKRIKELRERFDAVYLERLPTVNGKIGSSFIDKYAHLLD